LSIAGCSRSAVFATKRLFHRASALGLLQALEVARDANVLMRKMTIRDSV